MTVVSVQIFCNILFAKIVTFLKNKEQSTLYIYFLSIYLKKYMLYMLFDLQLYTHTYLF